MMKSRDRRQSGPPLPSVNVLSPWSFEALETRRLRQRFGLGCLLLTLIVGGGWGVQFLRVNHAEHALTDVQAETGLLTLETEELAPVRNYVSSVQRKKLSVQEAMKQEIYFSQVLDGLAAATPGGASVESAAVALNPAAAAAEEVAAGEAQAEVAPEVPVDAAVSCPGPDPFDTLVVVGCVTLSGTAADRRSVGDLVIGLGESDLFIEPFISTTTTASEDGKGQTVTFTGSVGLSDKVYSNRYADIDALLAREGAS
jgi:hypothetical protein